MRPKRLACAAFVALLIPVRAATAEADEMENWVAGQIAEAKNPTPVAAMEGPTGEEIYDKVLSNRFNSFDQSLKMTSGAAPVAWWGLKLLCFPSSPMWGGCFASRINSSHCCGKPSR